jgi:hypothetical protein
MHAIPARHKFSSGTVVATNDGREQPKKQQEYSTAAKIFEQ